MRWHRLAALSVPVGRTKAFPTLQGRIQHCDGQPCLPPQGQLRRALGQRTAQSGRIAQRASRRSQQCAQAMQLRCWQRCAALAPGRGAIPCR